jgi:hypothetical protein
MTWKPTRRALVLTSDGARHPFRQTLPPHVCARLVEEPRPSWWRQILDDDWKRFFQTYCAGFVAVVVYLA